MEGEAEEFQEKRPRGFRLALGGTIAVVLLAIAYMVNQRTRVSGELSAAGEAQPGFRLAFDQCDSGEWNGFFGVVLSDSKLPEVDLVVQRGPAVILKRGPVQVLLGQGSGGECRLLQARVERENASVNDIFQMDGELALDCETAEFGRVRGSARFQKCH